MNTHVTEQIKAVFFDHDDTLVGTFASKSRHHQHVARTYYGKELATEEIIAHWGKPLRELVCILYGTDDVAQAMAHNTSCHADFPKVLFEPTIPVLRRLKAMGKLTGIVTATSRFSFEHDLDEHGIPRECIDFTQTADDTPYHKPDKRVFDPAVAWLDERGVSPRETLYVGDGLLDMQAAVGAGFRFVGVETGMTTPDQFKAVGAISIPSVAQLL